MPRIKREIEQEDGWSRWVPPKMPLYRMACCDCSLVHDMTFKVVRVTATHPDGTWSFEEVSDPSLRVLFKARRNNRSTSAMRRVRDGG